MDSPAPASPADPEAQEDDHKEANRPDRVKVCKRVQCHPTEPRSCIVTQSQRRPGMRELVDRYGNHEGEERGQNGFRIESSKHGRLRRAAGIEVAGHIVPAALIDKTRLDLGTHIHRVWATRVEAAASRRVDRTGHISSQDDPFALLLDLRIGIGTALKSAFV